MAQRNSAIAVLAAAITFFAMPAGGQQGPSSMCCTDWWSPGWMHHDHWNPRHMRPGQKSRMMRHWTYMNEGVPSEYRGRRGAVTTNPETIAEGRVLYQTKCAGCHGSTGLGDGDAGRALSPSPALLSFLVRMPMAADEYLLWSISDGGERFGTDMPAFKDALSQDEIWKIIAFMRAGFPQSGTKQ